MKTMKINLGSGQRPFGDGWVNIDCQSKYNPDIVANGESLPMFSNNSIEMIVLHHVLEHFGCGEGAAMLKECHRILQHRGSLIITVPDVSALIRGFLNGFITEQVFMTNIYGAYLGHEADRHRWGFTWRSLETLLLDTASWRLVNPFDFRQIPGADIAKDWWILGVEAIKA